VCVWPIIIVFVDAVPFLPVLGVHFYFVLILVCVAFDETLRLALCLSWCALLHHSVLAFWWYLDLIYLRWCPAVPI
jgi:hypothetical protein